MSQNADGPEKGTFKNLRNNQSNPYTGLFYSFTVKFRNSSGKSKPATPAAKETNGKSRV